jgi:hypothetical protein
MDKKSPEINQLVLAGHRESKNKKFFLKKKLILYF